MLIGVLLHILNNCFCVLDQRLYLSSGTLVLNLEYSSDLTPLILDGKQWIPIEVKDEGEEGNANIEDTSTNLHVTIFSFKWICEK